MKTRLISLLAVTILLISCDKKIDYVPIYMYKNSNAKSHKFKILDIEKSIAKYESGDTSSISPTVYTNLKTQLEKIKSILGDEIN